MKKQQLTLVSSLVRQAMISLACLFLLATSSYSATFYVTGGGTKTSGASTANDWSNSNCYGSISAAISKMSGGDEVVVNDGTYTNAGTTNSISGMPSGSSGNFTRIRARNPFAVTLDNQGSGDYNSRLIELSGSYVEVDGFKVRQRNSTPEEAITLSGDHLKLRRTMLRVEAMNDYTFGLAVSSGSSYILVEDCAFVGGFRYMVGVRCSSGSASYIIFRRVVARGDWANTNQPHSLFAVYGHNSSASSGPHHIYYQNCMAIDTAMISTNSTYKHVPWYIFKGNHDVMLEGCITLNNQIPYYFFFRNDFDGYNMEIKDSLFADNQGSTTTGTFRGSSSSSGYDRLHGCTFYGQPRGLTWNGTTSNGYIKNNLFVDLGDNSIAFTGSHPPTSYNSFDKSGQEFGTNVVAFNRDLLYLPRVESNSNRYTGGDTGARVGAHIMGRIGAPGTLYGEAGWNATNQDSLWPWPYESEIYEWFRAAVAPPSGASPSTNDTTRGFCAAGQTLTNYIWGYLGNPIPGDFGSAAPPLSPASMKVKQVTVN